MTATAMFRTAARRLSFEKDDAVSNTPCRPSTSPRILLLSASVGSGHIRAAQAIHASLARLRPDAEIVHQDVLQLTNAPFRALYGRGYIRTVESLPHLVGMLYDLSDRPHAGGARARCRSLLARVNFARLTRLLLAQPWDLAICTHFLPTGMLSSLKRRGRISFPHVTVVTDFDVHGLWVDRPCDAYFVATDHAAAVLAATGVNPPIIHPTGIPIDSVFTQSPDRAAVRERFGFSSDRPLVMQLGGGFGLGSVQQIHESLRAVQTPLDIVVVAGKNAEAKASLEALPPHPLHRVHVLGFTKEMDALLAAADLVVSKPGGLTTSECLARGCPMMIVEPIPGQEERNSDFLLESGCAVRVRNLATITHRVESLLAEPGRLTAMRSAALQRGRPNAAADVASHCVGLIPAATTHRVLPPRR